MESDRRQHRRLEIRLPLEGFESDGRRVAILHSATGNISTGGVLFEGELADGCEPPAVNSLLTVELTVPPGDGHFPYEGRVRSIVEVLRCDVLGTLAGPEPGPRRVAVAARFREPLKLAF